MSGANESSVAAVSEALSRALDLGFDSAGSVYFLHCLSSLPRGHAHPLLPTVIKRIEEEYYSSNPGWLNPASPYARLLVDSGLIINPSMTFQSLVKDLPLKCKVLIMAYRHPSPSKGSKSVRPFTKSEIEARWHNLDPVDMEDVEREHYLKTGKILRTRHVEAKAVGLRSGSRLAQTLGMECLSLVPEMSIEDISQVLSALLSNSRNAIFHRDLKSDAQFIISKRLLTLRDEDIGSHILPVALALTHFEPNLEIVGRVWNRKVIPAIRRASTDLSVCPREYEHLNQVSRAALLCSAVIGSGRIRVTDRLMSYFSGKLLQGISDIDEDILLRLLDSFTRSGYVDQAIINAISSESLSILSLVRLIQTRSHFGLFGSSYEDSVDLLHSRVENESEIDSTMSLTDQLMTLNCLMSGSRAGTESAAVMRLAKRLSAVYPDLDLDRLGRLGSVLE